MGLFKFYSHLAKPVARRCELFLLLLGAAMPALLLLPFPRFEGRLAFLVFFLVAVVQTCMLVQHLVARRLNAPVAPAIATVNMREPSWVAHCSGNGSVRERTRQRPGRRHGPEAPPAFASTSTSRIDAPRSTAFTMS